MPQSENDRNEYAPYGLIRLSGGLGLFAKVDFDDLPELTKYAWIPVASRRTFYAIRSTKVPGTRKTVNIRMHRVLLSAPSDLIVDHINGDGLDNRRCNIRLVTARQNAQNRAPLNLSSRFKGVSWKTSDKVWRTQICWNGKRLTVGYFKDETEAAHAYDKKARELFGPFARLNFPEVAA